MKTIFVERIVADKTSINRTQIHLSRQTKTYQKHFQRCLDNQVFQQIRDECVENSVCWKYLAKHNYGVELTIQFGIIIRPQPPYLTCVHCWLIDESGLIIEPSLQWDIPEMRYYSLGSEFKHIIQGFDENNKSFIMKNLRLLMKDHLRFRNRMYDEMKQIIG